MKNTTKIALSNLFSAAGSLLIALTAEFGDDKPQETTATPEAPKKPRKGAAAAPVVTEPAQSETPAEPEAPAEQPTGAELKAQAEITNPKYEQHRALIAPLVQGEESTAELRQQVKDLVKKYDPDNTPHSLRTMPTKNHAAFEKDIAALGY